jgi:flagellar motor switch protein FliM
VWSPVAPIGIGITRYESNPEFIQIIPSAEPVVVISLQIKIHDNKTLMNFCYPYSWMTDIIGRPDVQDRLKFGSEEASDEERDMLKNHLLKVTCPVRATLGGTSITVQDFINLQIGDLLVLDKKTDEENTIFIKDRPMYKGIIGRRDKYRAVLVTDIIKKEQSHAV